MAGGALFVCVRSHTDTHSHSHTQIHTMAGTARGRFRRATWAHAHGELEAHGGSGEEVWYSCVRESDGRRDSRAMVCKEGAGGGPREAIPGRTMGGRRACVLTECSQRAVEGGGASKPLRPEEDLGDRGSKEHKAPTAIFPTRSQIWATSLWTDRQIHSHQSRSIRLGSTSTS